MRALAWLLAAALSFSAGCKKPPPQVDTIEDENQPALSVVPMAHPRAAPQLLSGLYDVEQGAWRWTMGRFAIALEPPPGAASKGAVLEVNLTAPVPVLARFKSVTLSAAVEGMPLAPETYTTPGDYTYTREVPAAALTVAPVKVTFALDHYLKAGEVERRELGIILTRAGLVAADARRR